MKLTAIIETHYEYLELTQKHMTYNFKKFEGRNLRLESRITITKSNSIGFPQKFYNDNNINNYKYVVLYWDAQNKAVGIHFTNDDNEKSKFSIMRSKVGYGGGVIARSFFKANEINPKEYHGRYEWKKEEIGEIGTVFIIELKEHEKK